MTIAAILAVTTLVNTPTQVSANTDYSDMSTTQLIELINQLKAQIASLQVKSSTECFVSDTTLTIGDGEGDGLTSDVIRLQAFLREKGHFTFYKNTGFFGKITKSALTSFQLAYGLTQTGNYDGATREKAHAMTCKNAEVSYKKVETKDYEKKSTPTSVVSSITASADNGHITWSTDGTSAKGFKIVWSKTSGPTYPTRKGSDKYYYKSDPSTDSTDIYAFDGTGKYYVRVCEYLGGACGTYSNEVTTPLE